MIRSILIGIVLGTVVTSPAQAGSLSVAAGKSDLQPPSDFTAAEVLPFTTAETASRPVLLEFQDVPDHGNAEISQWEIALRQNLRVTYDPLNKPYDLERFADQTRAIRWDVAGIYGLAGVIGFSEWDWGGAPFHFKREGWFGKDTKYLGMDKLGHAYTGYILSEYFTSRISNSAEDRSGAALTGGLLGMGIQTYVELLDGFSENGFSPEDFLADGIGAGFSVLRSSVPGLSDKVDFRMEYLPSGNKGTFEPYSDYSGQKYFLALKLGGFERFEDTPLRFVELQAGYYARGFTDKERERGDDLRREPFAAVAINLQELLDATPAREATPTLLGKRALGYVQLPYTYVPTN